MVIDLHVVVPQGGDSGTLDRLLDACIESGLEGVCLLGAGGPPPVDAARTGRFAGRIALFFGIEFPLERGRLLWIPEDPAALEAGEWRTAAGEQPTLASVAAVREQCGGVVLAAHPYDRTAGPAFVDSVFALKDIDGVFITTASLDRVRNHMALEAAQRLNVVALGGSGSAANPLDIGGAATVFPGDVPDQAALVAAIRRKDAWTVEMLTRPDQLEPEDEGGRDRDRGRGGRDGRGGYGRGEPRGEHRGDSRGERRPDGRRDGRGDGRHDGRGDRPQAPRGPGGHGSSGGPGGPGGPAAPGGGPREPRDPRPDREPREPLDPQAPRDPAAAGAPPGEGGHRRRRRRGGRRGPGEGGGTPSPQAPEGGGEA